MDTLTEIGYPQMLDWLSHLRAVAMKTSAGKPGFAYSYLRYSEPKQEEGDSLRRQTEYRAAWLARNPQVTLDTTLRLEDRGVSGFKGKHRLDPRNAMAQFARCVEEGRVAAGSYLIVENLDRLTREHPVHALPWVLGLIAKGIRVVQLTPREHVYDSSMNESELIGLLLELARGHGESKRKAALISDQWEGRRQRAREGTPYGAAVPGWIALKDGKYVLDLEHADSLRRMYEWSAEGLGIRIILSRLTESGAKPWGRSGKWCPNTIAAALSSRAALGEFQPRDASPARNPIGEPIADYFPRVVSDELWERVQAAKASRCRHGGRPSRSGLPTSPFAGLLFDAATGQTLRVKDGGAGLTLSPSGAVEGRTRERSCRFPLSHFVDGLLSALVELKASALFADPVGSQIADVEVKLSRVRKRLEVAQQQWRNDPESAAWQAEVQTADREQRALAAEARRLRLEASHPLSATWEQAIAEIRSNDPVRLRQCLLGTVAGVWSVFVRRGAFTLAAVQVWFQGGEVNRDYLIASFKPTGCKAKQRAGRWQLLTLPSHPDGRLDLRNRTHARAMLALLREVEVPSA